jgi:hypothetical protein
MVDERPYYWMIIQKMCARISSIHAPSSPTDSHPLMPMISLELRLILINTFPALSKCRLQPKSNSGYITLGGMDEAIDYVNSNIKPWIRTSGAIEWIVNRI